MKVQGKGATIAGETYRSLRESILNGEINPGDRIRTQELCDEYDVSLGAVRESLSQLMVEGLVLSEAHRGYTVAPLSIDDLKDLTRTRIEIENLCLKWSIEAGGLAWESEVLAATHRLTNVYRIEVRAEPGAHWVQAHDVYHAALTSACGSPRLLKVRQQLYDQSERYRKLESTLVRKRDADDEHKRIADAAVAHNTDLAIRLMTRHISLTTENIIKAMEKKNGVPLRAAGKSQPADRNSQREKPLSRSLIRAATTRR